MIGFRFSDRDETYEQGHPFGLSPLLLADCDGLVVEEAGHLVGDELWCGEDRDVSLAFEHDHAAVRER
jgi:hypothetical protein